MMSSLPTDQQVIEAIQMKHHLFTTKFCQKNSPLKWDSVDHMYFKHLCTVLKHTEAIFSLDVEALANKKMKMNNE